MKREYCDLCGRESNTTCIKIRIAQSAERIFDCCQTCENELGRRITQAQIDFAHSTKWWKDNQKENGDIDYGSFHMVGTAEQGGYVCPKCGYCNNAYTFTFSKKCEKCGYEKQG